MFFSYTLIIWATNDVIRDTSSFEAHGFINSDPQYPSSDEKLDPASNSSLLRLVITVSDIIDDPPRFTRHSYVTLVETGASPGTQIFTVGLSRFCVMKLSVEFALFEPSSRPVDTKLFREATQATAQLLYVAKNSLFLIQKCSKCLVLEESSKRITNIAASCSILFT